LFYLQRRFGPTRGVSSFLVRHDPYTYEPLRDKNGRCIISKPGIWNYNSTGAIEDIISVGVEISKH